MADDDVCAVAAEQTSHWSGLGISIASVVLLLSVLVGTALLVLSRVFDRWYAAAVSHAFSIFDADHDGKIHFDELHVGVLRLYLKLHTMNILCEAPSREAIAAILHEHDFDRDGRLDKEDFAQVIRVLSVQVFGRAVATLVLLITLPICAGLLWATAADAITGGRPVEQWGADVPAAAQCVFAVVETLHLGPTLLTAVAIPVGVPLGLRAADRLLALMPASTRRTPARRREQRIFGTLRAAPAPPKGADPTPLLPPIVPPPVEPPDAEAPGVGGFFRGLFAGPDGRRQK